MTSTDETVTHYVVRACTGYMGLRHEEFFGNAEEAISVHNDYRSRGIYSNAFAILSDESRRPIAGDALEALIERTQNGRA
jgi:hypothetical protein